MDNVAVSSQPQQQKRKSSTATHVAYNQAIAKALRS